MKLKFWSLAILAVSVCATEISRDKRATVSFLTQIWAVSSGDVVNSPIVSVEWPVVGRPAWCHILGEKMFRLFHQTPILAIWHI